MGKDNVEKFGHGEEREQELKANERLSKDNILLPLFFFF